MIISLVITINTRHAQEYILYFKVKMCLHYLYPSLSVQWGWAKFIHPGDF